MLRIRADQMQVLGRPGAERLLAGLCAYLRDNHVGDAHELAPETLRARVTVAVAVASRRGMTLHRSIAYVNLMFLLGPRCDRQPAIQGVLHRRGVAPDALVEEMLARLEPQDWEDARRHDPSWDGIDEERA